MLLATAAFVVRLWNALTMYDLFFSLPSVALFEEIVIWLILLPLAAPAYGTVGAVILARQPGNLMAWLCMATGTLIALQDIFWQITLRAATDHWPGLVLLALITVWMSAPNLPPLPFTVLLLLFPDGRLLSPRWRWVGVLAVGTALIQGLAGTFYPQLFIGLPNPVDNPLGLEALENFTLWIGQAGFFLALLALVLALTAMLIRRRRATGQARQQLKWLAFASGLLLILVILAVLVSSVEPLLGTFFFIGAVAVGALGIPGAIGIALLRYRLYDIDLVMNRAAVYALLTAVLAVIYLGSVMLLQGLLHLLTEETSGLAVFASSWIIAALFSPLRRRVQATIDRHFDRRRYDMAQVLASFSAVARDEVDLQRLEERLLEVVAETMEPTHLSLWLRDPAPKSQA